MAAHRRHDISNKLWELLEEHLPGSKGKVGRPSSNNRLFINAVFWILRTGAPWRDLPPDLGDWKNNNADSAAGAIVAYGKNCWKSLSINRIMNG